MKSGRCVYFWEAQVQSQGTRRGAFSTGSFTTSFFNTWAAGTTCGTSLVAQNREVLPPFLGSSACGSNHSFRARLSLTRVRVLLYLAELQKGQVCDTVCEIPFRASITRGSTVDQASLGSVSIAIASFLLISAALMISAALAACA